MTSTTFAVTANTSTWSMGSFIDPLIGLGQAGDPVASRSRI